MSKAFLTKTFNTATRGELIQLVEALACATPSHMILDKYGSPIIIQVEGGHNAGKSLYWDIYKDTLFEKQSEMIETYTPDNVPKDDCRYPELWGGQYKDEDLKILFFNAGVCLPQQGRELLGFIMRRNSLP